MPASDAIAARVKRMRQDGAKRDEAMHKMLRVRGGDIDELDESIFSEEIPKSIAANFIDTAARDISELLAPLPTLTVDDEDGVSMARKNAAAKKVAIGYQYWYESRLPKQMFTACDQYVSFSVLPFLVEPDYIKDVPIIYCVSPVGSYYETDRLGDCQVFVHVDMASVEQLAYLYPEWATQILTPPDRFNSGNDKASATGEIELITYYDADRKVCYLPDRKNLVLCDIPNPLGRCPVTIAERPGAAGPRGQFDDSIPIQQARAMMARYGLDAAAQSVQAPLALPDDVTQLAIGPGAVIRTSQPDKIRRVGMELPPGAFQLEQTLEAELRLGTRYPDARSGEMQGNIVTGRGVQALQGTLDTQIKTAQETIGPALAAATAMAYEMDVKVWPNRSRKFYAVMGGVSISETYTPSKDIKDDYRCDAVYGFAAGLGVSQAVVMIEQMINGGLISRALGRRQLALGEDPIKMEKEVNTQQVRDGLMQGVTAMAQSANVILEQGGDPSQILAKVATMIREVQKGVAIEDAYTTAFPVPPPAPPQADPNAPPGPPGAPGAPGGGGAPAGMSDNTGLPQGTAAPGQAPGGRPSLQSLVAGLSSSGQANLSDSSTSRVPSLG